MASNCTSMTEYPFFPPLVPYSARSLSEALSLELVGDSGNADAVLSGVAPLEEAEPGTLSFLDNPRYAVHLGTTGASCVIIAPKFVEALPATTVALVSREPYRDFARAAALMQPAGSKLLGMVRNTGVATTAVIHADASLEPDVSVEAGAVIGPGVAIGAGTIVCAGAVIGQGVQIGRGGYIGANSSIQHALLGDAVIVHPNASLGQDGFGFAMGAQGHLKVPQLGRVIIQNNVEIGAGTCIDRGTTRDTVVGEGTKIDNLVQVGHNVEIGRHCILVGQVAIAGSTVIEDFVAIGGQSGIAGHIRIGMGAQIAAASSVKDSVPPGGRWAGTPAKPARQVFRELAALKRLAERGDRD
jgi:UDP-3-O-[3-hydroxymyristoyl] glucosamine N-acyltransferase